MFLRRIMGAMKESAKSTSKRPSLETGSGVVWEGIQHVSGIANHHPEKEMSHREEAKKTRVGYVVCDIHHGFGRM
jgi:hypothetical protein